MDLVELCNRGNIKGVKDAIAADINSINTYNKHGDTPLTIACWTGNVEIVKLLLAAGAKIDKPDLQQARTPFYLACLKGYYEIAELLIQAGANIDALAQMGTALTIACEKGSIKLVNMLIKNKADVNKSNRGRTPLFFACNSGLPEIVQALLQADAAIETDNRYEPFFAACSPSLTSWRSGCVELLLPRVSNAILITAIRKRDNSHLLITVALETEWWRRQMKFILLAHSHDKSSLLTSIPHELLRYEISRCLLAQIKKH